jgi:PIN domain nuclease of toxin-antitoxin system
MKALLDTHVFLWHVAGDRRLSARCRNLIESADRELFLSVAGVWEIVLKHQLGRLTLDRPPGQYVRHYMRELRLRSMPIKLKHVLHMPQLPLHHRDPFDRIQIAQARVESMPILTRDSLISKYDVPVLW